MQLPPQSDPYADQRRAMVQTQLRDRGITDDRVLAAMLRVPRHEFIAVPFRDEAYEDHPLPIGSGQTISQPYIVASMLQALHLAASDKVLEVGAGSGYVTALLAELAAEVVSIERHQVLAAQAQQALVTLGYDRVRIVVGDGTQGFAPAAPYDAIIVSAAAPQLPVLLVSQLREGGRMIVPVGPDDAQQLQLIRIENGQPQISLREPCRFVPLVSG
ncbi:MAG TPA: protein-L-isoaspartate(D-aspartate) O-methyltransferase [Candidatus Sulfotelmatobacter sp.]|nr:protein-L-isoaspartate(D-aspartate) O-methyltransferase [Candidatus Sulfotelmatobacter sp.]